MKLYRTAAIIFMSANLLLAEDIPNVSKNIINSYVGEDSAVSTGGNISSLNYGYNKEYDYSKERIFRIYKKYMKGSDVERVESVAKKVNFTNEVATQATNKKSIPKSLTNQISNYDTYIGVCKFPTTVNIIKKRQYKLPCKTQKHGYIDVVLDLIPINSDFVLQANAKYIIDDRKFLAVDQSRSIITNINDTDTNIATYVNTREIEKYANITKSSLAQGVSNATKQYIEQKQAAASTQEMSKDSNGNSIVVTNTKTPSAGEYLMYGLVDGVTNVIKKSAELMNRDLPYLYSIEKGSVIHINISVMQEKK